MSTPSTATASTRGHPDLPPRPSDAPAETWDYVCRAYAWHDVQARRSRIAYWCFKLVTLGSAALVTVLASAGFDGVTIAVPAASGLLAEGVQQTGQFHVDYIAYRLVAESVYTQAWLYAADSAAGAPSEQQTRAQILAAGVAQVLGTQNGDWARRMRQAAPADQV
jgi:hypothetical protein